MTTVFGTVNFFAHLITVCSPIVAELAEPIPFYVFCFNAAVAIAFALQLIEVELAKKREMEKERKLKRISN